MKKSANISAVLSLIILLVGLPLLGQGKARALKGSIVYLKVPYKCFQGKMSFWGNAVLRATIRAAENGISVNNDSDWRLSAFPPLTEYKVKKSKVDPQTRANEVELTSDVYPTVKLFIGRSKLDEYFPFVVATKEEVADYQKDTYKLLAAKFFDGTPMAELSEEKKIALCIFAHITASGTTMGSTTYKDNLYLVVDLGSDTSVYNELKLNQAQRVANVLNERLLTILKNFTIPIKDELNIFGLKLEFLIPHRSFANDNADPVEDKLEIYAPIELILQFSEADITSQQFIDGCIVIVDGNRISVPLAGYLPQRHIPLGGGNIINRSHQGPLNLPRSIVLALE